MRTLLLLAALAASFGVVGCKPDVQTVREKTVAESNAKAAYHDHRRQLFERCEYSGPGGRGIGDIRLIGRNDADQTETYRCRDGSTLTVK